MVEVHANVVVISALISNIKI